MTRLWNSAGVRQPNIIRYTGGALDLSTGLLKLGQRYYNPATGAFTQQDANQLLASPQNGNLYAYAGDNPANFIDPTGRNCFGDTLGAIGGVLVFGGAVFTAPETFGGSLLVAGVGFGSLGLDVNAAGSCLGFNLGSFFSSIF